MERRRLLIIWAVIVFVLVGGVMLFIGITQDEDTSYGDKPGGVIQLDGLR
ncbi:MAG: hypothetical protein Q7J48_18865 [Nocardioides sp.]|nr:hypothetical protein [Nocardioides sp.]